MTAATVDVAVAAELSDPLEGDSVIISSVSELTSGHQFRVSYYTIINNRAYEYRTEVNNTIC